MQDKLRDREARPNGNGHNVPADLVREHTPPEVNQYIDQRMAERIYYYASQPKAVISRRIDELDQEWDIERIIEIGASSAAIIGMALGIAGRKRWLLLPMVVMPILFFHATQGWCPPSVVFLRGLGIRTRKEIDAEKYALKALRGDFSVVPPEPEPPTRASSVLQAVNS